MRDCRRGVANKHIRSWIVGAQGRSMKSCMAKVSVACKVQARVSRWDRPLSSWIRDAEPILP